VAENLVVMGGTFGKRKSLLATILVLLFLTAGNAFAADTYLVSARFFHLGQLIGQSILAVEEGITAAGSWSQRGWGQYTVAALVRPVADGQVYVSLQFASGNVAIQPNLLVDIGRPSSFTIKKVRVELLVEDLGEAEPAVPMQLTQNSSGVQPR
jgi:hypothetical protein